MRLIPRRIIAVATAVVVGLMMAIIFLQFVPVTIEEISLRELLIILLTILMVVFGVAYYLIESGNQPISEILRVIDDLANSRYSARYYGAKYAKEDELGGKINSLATKLQRKTQQLHMDEEKLAALVDHLIIGVFLLDKRGVITLTNPASQSFFADMDGLEGRRYIDLSRSYGLLQLIDLAYDSLQMQHSEIYMYYPQEKIIDVNVIPVVNEEGQLDQVIVLLYDISEIRRLEKVRSEFVANASHELRTPVTALQGFSETLLDGAMDDPEMLRKFLGIIHKESVRLDRLINDILQLSKLEQKAAPLKSEVFDLRELIQENSDLVISRARDKQLRWVIDGAQRLSYKGDKQRLGQIISNLMTNAINYTDEGGTVTTSLSQDAEGIHIAIKDTGIGIPEKDLERIFERFYRVDKARSSNTGGTGLGLSIVKNLAHSMGASISVDSHLGKGSTFTIHLPIRNETNANDQEF